MLIELDAKMKVDQPGFSTALLGLWQEIAQTVAATAIEGNDQRRLLTPVLCRIGAAESAESIFFIHRRGYITHCRWTLLAAWLCLLQ
ncbi:MAG: hypothetical protein V7629_11940 [Motiliproteus sp.]